MKLGFIKSPKKIKKLLKRESFLIDELEGIINE